MPNLPRIPETITVHLGAPDQSAANVTLSVPDYIKNVASSEVYPTWPEEAIRANIYAQISFALNRVYTEFYRNQPSRIRLRSWQKSSRARSLPTWPRWKISPD